MTISSGLHNAYSGLSAAARAAETVSNNLANAMTEGFSRREIVLSSSVIRGFGQGVTIDGVDRAVDRVATASRREAGTASDVATAELAAFERMRDAFGDPVAGGDLATRLTTFEAAIVSAANDPANTIALDLTSLRAGELTTQLNRASVSLNAIRQDADAAIAKDVETLNTALEDIRTLNMEIRRRVNGTGDIHALTDRRDQLIDTVSRIVPVMVVPQAYEQVALYTPNGGVLINNSNTIQPLSFLETPVISHGMTLGAPLSGLTQNGNAITIGNGAGPFAGGTLAAHFDIRDRDVPAAIAQLDGLARDLIERFEDPAVDTSLAVGDPGLFTDGGAAFVVTSEVGVAGRIAVNAAADPNQGGAGWRVRDGMNAVAPGLAGNNTILRNMESAMTAQRAPGAGLGLVASMSASGFFGTIVSGVAQATGRRDETAEFAQMNHAIAREVESSRIGVDSDEQLQKLMEVEKYYAANARVMQVLDEMLEELLRIR